jgi:predicted RNA-binding Zn-ribbon protein involved in translation (DUF1610 family)
MTHFKANELEYFNEFTDKWVTLGLPCTKIRVKPRETQLDLQIEVAKKTGINIVTCGDCGSTLLHRIADETITCPDCGFSSEPCDFPDLNY